ncbi:MAG: hypothetical protein AAF576_04265, partial [Pseudomonadota bacterium]
MAQRWPLEMDEMSNYFDNEDPITDTSDEGSIDTVVIPSTWRDAEHGTWRKEDMSDGPKQGHAPGTPSDQAKDQTVQTGAKGATGSLEAFASQVLSFVAAKSPASRDLIRHDL